MEMSEEPLSENESVNELQDEPALSEIQDDDALSSRIASSMNASSVKSFPQYDIDASLNVSTIKKELEKFIKSPKGQRLLKACRNFDMTGSGKIAKSHMRMVLRTFCFPITAAQFDFLCNEMRIDSNKKINYVAFLKAVSGLPSLKIERPPKKMHDNIPIDEVELRLKDEVRKNLRDIIRACWLFDVNKDGFIQKREMRRIIHNYCFELSDYLYNELWRRYDNKGTGIVCYKTFLIKLGINAERYKHYIPPNTVAAALCTDDSQSQEMLSQEKSEQYSRRAALENKDDPIIQGMPLAEVKIVFLYKLKIRARVLKKAFHVFDYEKNGQIPEATFHGIINYYILPMSTPLFHRLMECLGVGISSKNKIDCNSFFTNFCKKTLAETRPENSRKAEPLDCLPVVQRIKNRVIDPTARLKSVFTRMTEENEWQITRQELKRAIEKGLNFSLTDDEFKDLTTILDPGSTNIINCKDFISLFDNSCGSEFQESEASEEGTAPEDKYQNLTGTKLKKKLKYHMDKQKLNVERAFLVADLGRSGLIAKEKMHEILNTFCFPLSNEQFRDIISDLFHYQNSINYNEFFEKNGKKPDEDTYKWVEIVTKLAPFKSKCDPTMPIDEAEEMLYDCIRSKSKAMLNDFKILDICKVGITYKHDVRKLLEKYAFRLTDEQFEALWKKFPLTERNQFLYEEFLARYGNSTMSKSSNCSECNSDVRGREINSPHPTIQKEEKGRIGLGAKPQGKYEETKHMGQEKGSCCQGAKEYNPPLRFKGISKAELYASAPQLEAIFNKLEPAIRKNYLKISYELRKVDPKTTGIITFITFKTILDKNGAIWSKEDEFHILEQFDLDLAGKIKYREFLRFFVWYA